MAHALPKAGRLYLSALRSQYLLLHEFRGTPLSPSITALLEAVDAKPQDASWSDVFAVELAVIDVTPDDQLSDQLLRMRGRYRDVIGNDAYALYAQTSPDDLSMMTALQQRAELIALAQRLHYIYLFDPPKESVRTRLAIWAAVLALVATLAGVFVFDRMVLAQTQGFSPIFPVVLALFAGQIGGFISVQQRLQGGTGVDPLFKEMQLSAGWFSVVIVAPFIGAIFALVLYLIFAGELLKGGIFPDFSKNLDPKTGYLMGISFQDWSKLLVWCFIAGFAERFVPDVLTRLTGSQYAVGGEQPGGLRVPSKGLVQSPGSAARPLPVVAAPAGGGSLPQV